jgi:magnesium chelatase subunit H
MRTGRDIPVRVVIVTMDRHLAGAADRAERALREDLPGLKLALHAASDWRDDPDALERCRRDIERGDIVIATMLFMEDHIKPVLPWLEARRHQCDAMAGCLSAGEVVKLTRLGDFTMGGQQGRIISLLKRLRGSGKKPADAGASQMRMLRRLPKILRFIPGKAQDLRAYFMTLQYWLAGSDHNVADMVRFLISRYAAGPRAALRDSVRAGDPIVYPDVGLYHPKSKNRISESIGDLPTFAAPGKGKVGVLLMRSYVLSGDAGHYDGVIAALEARGLDAVPAFAAGLDSRPAVEKFFMKDGKATVDAVVSLTGFSLVGGPAYNDAKSAEDMLAALDVPYIAAQSVEFQSLDSWEGSDAGLMPLEATMMVAIPELDGATGPMVIGGRSGALSDDSKRDMQVHAERADALAARVEKLITLRKKDRAERNVAVVLFNFPPNAGATGTAALLSVFDSLHNTLTTLKAAGYTVEVPESVDALRQCIVEGNSGRYGTDANVHATISADDHVRYEPHLAEIEAQWGPAPGRVLTNGGSIFIQGARFGNVFVGVQPGFGYEGDPMRLLFEKNFAPTHAFCAFYRYLKTEFAADAVLHFGTHGALEFMPGKQTGMSEACWPDRLIGDLPNLYLYAANNPSEGMIAKRRAAATLVSYLTPPISAAGLYKGLIELKASIERFRMLPPEADVERGEIAEVIKAQAGELDLPTWDHEAEQGVSDLLASIHEVETTLIPSGLHVVGEPMSREERIDMLAASAEANADIEVTRESIEAIVDGREPRQAIDEATLQTLTKTSELLAEEHELPALIHALDGGFIRPVVGGDLIRSPEILPTGRNVHGFDPFRLPSTFACLTGARQAEQLLQRHVAEGNGLPETIAVVLWGTDNLKTEGDPIAQALTLIGAKPRFDSFGRLAGAELTSLEELGRPRIDVVMTLSGIFRDLLPLQTKLLAEAAFLAASAHEPVERNFVKKHALAYQAEHDCDLETAALRVFSNADGAYGSNVNMMVESSCWDDEDELAETYTKRKSFAYGRDGTCAQQPALLNSVFSNVQLAYQNLESVEVGVTTLDHYFDTLGGISRAVKRAKGGDGVPVYIGDQTRGKNVVRTISEQVSIETRTRMLNPKWCEDMLKHGYEGVRQIESHITNTMGWSATTDQVAPWVYKQLSETYVLDKEMRRRLSELNPKASARMAGRLLEAHERHYWTPDEATLEALKDAGEELEDRLEGVGVEAMA